MSTKSAMLKLMDKLVKETDKSVCKGAACVERGDLNGYYVQACRADTLQDIFEWVCKLPEIRSLLKKGGN